MKNYSFVSESAFLFVTVDELKRNLRVTNDLEFSFMESLLKTAIQYVEEHAQIRLAEKNYIFTTCKKYGKDSIWLEVCPIKTVTNFSYLDADNSIQSIAIDDLILSISEDECIITPVNDWPIMSDANKAITISFTTGYPDSIEPPLNLKQAVILLASHWFNHRTASENKLHDIPHGVMELINLSKRGWY